MIEASTQQFPSTGEPDKMPSVFRVLKDFHDLFEGILATQEGQEVSTPRLLLRAVGHSAVGTEFPDDSGEIPEVPHLPPVNLWELTKTVAKTVFSRQHRREIVGRLADELTPPDYLGLMGVAAFYRHSREQGLGKDEARTQAWTGYMNSAEH